MFDIKMPTKSNWINIKDRLPESTEWVLVVGIYGEPSVYVAKFLNDNRGSKNTYCWNWVTPSAEDARGITHWQNLPEPPTLQNDEK